MAARDNSLLDSLENALIKAGYERAKRPLDPNDHENTGWVLHERLLMLDEVNKHRERLGLPPVTIDKVRKTERNAEGHSDYQHKFALGCRDLVVEGAS
jgi:hypothetical protein